MIAEKISLQGLDKAEVLAALYNASHPQGMGFMQYDPKPMTKEEAKDLLKCTCNFDYLMGRVMKVDLSGDDFSPWGYDRDNGHGSAEEAIRALRLSGDVNPISVQVAHEDGKHRAADNLLEHLPGETTIEQNHDGVVMNLGLADVADVLKLVLDAKMQDKHEPQDFTKLAREGERVKAYDSVSEMIYKISEGDRVAMDLLQKLMDNGEFFLVLLFDSKHLYGTRITQLYKEICGEDMERFLYHVQMELPDQGTGKLSITGPYCSQIGFGEESNAYFVARKYGKPGSFWALENPPTDPFFQYPIRISADGQIEKINKTYARLIGTTELCELTQNIEGMNNPRARRGLLDSVYARAMHGRTNFSPDAISGFQILLHRYGFQNHAVKLVSGNYPR